MRLSDSLVSEKKLYRDQHYIWFEYQNDSLAFADIRDSSRIYFIWIVHRPLTKDNCYDSNFFFITIVGKFASEINQGCLKCFSIYISPEHPTTEFSNEHVRYFYCSATDKKIWKHSRNFMCSFTREAVTNCKQHNDFDFLVSWLMHFLSSSTFCTLLSLLELLLKKTIGWTDMRKHDISLCMIK